MDQFDLSSIFSDQSFQDTIELLSRDESSTISGLEKLETILVYGNEELLVSFPINEIFSIVNELLRSSNNATVLSLASKCMQLVLDATVKSTNALMSINAPETLFSHIKTIADASITPNCYGALYTLSQFRASQLSRIIKIGDLLIQSEFFDNITQLKACKISINLLNCPISVDCKRLIPIIEQFSQNKPVNIKEKCFEIVEIWVNRNNESVLNDEITIKHITQMAQSATNEKLLSIFAKILCKLSSFSLVIPHIISSNMDVGFLLFNQYLVNYDPKYIYSVLCFISNILPINASFDRYGKVLRHQRNTDSAKIFAEFIQPFLINFFLEKRICQEFTIQCLIWSFEFHKASISSQFFIHLSKLLELSDFYDYALEVMWNCRGQSTIFESGILNVFDSYKTKLNEIQKQKLKEINEFILEKMEDNINFSTSNLQDIISMIQKDNVANNVNRVLPRLLNIISDNKHEIDQHIEVLNSFCIKCLDYVFFTKSYEAKNWENFLNLLTNKTFVNVITDSGNMSLIIQGFESCKAIELQLNDGFSYDRIEKQMEYYLYYNSIEDLDEYSTSVKSYIFQSFINDYVSYIFEISQQCFPPSIDLVSYLSDETTFCDSQFVSQFVEIRAKRSTEEIEYDFVHELQLSDSSRIILDFVKLIYSTTNKMVLNPEFIKRVESSFLCFFDVFCTKSQAVSLVFNYPYLFPLETRYFLLQILTINKLRLFHNVIPKRIQIDLSKVPKHEVIKVKVHRESLFDDGIALLRCLIRNYYAIEVYYHNEVAVGSGPTHEFFTLMAREFCLKSRSCFRNECTNKEYLYCHSQKGLFLAPNLSNENAECLGAFVAKVINFECNVEMSFNPAFFKLLRNEEVLLEEVDPILKRSLESETDLYGLAFVYPGYGDFPLMENGMSKEVDQNNVKEYKSQIFSYTCGEKMKEKAKFFLKGFNGVFPFSSLRLFENDEIPKLILGYSPIFSQEELMKNIICGSGYNLKSQTIQNFVSVVSSLDQSKQKLFIKFITGYCNLPIGGLSALYPKITIAKKDDTDLLPSVMTCTHYLKLPSYSTEEILSEKLLKAILEGNEYFTHT